MQNITANCLRLGPHIRMTMAGLIAAVAVSVLAGGPAAYAAPIAQSAGVACDLGEAAVCAPVTPTLGAARKCSTRGDDRGAKACEQVALAEGLVKPVEPALRTARLHP